MIFIEKSSDIDQFHRKVNVSKREVGKELAEQKEAQEQAAQERMAAAKERVAAMEGTRGVMEAVDTESRERKQDVAPASDHVFF